MDPHFLKVINIPGTSFKVRRDLAPINKRWHCHEEIELIYIIKGTGTLLLGDHLRLFSEGTICLIGAHVPHYWRFDDKYDATGTDSIDVIAIHFTESFWGQEFLKLPENSMIRLLLENAKTGILIHGEIMPVIHLFERLLNAEKPHRIILLLELLLKIAEWDEISYLSTASIQFNIDIAEEVRINNVYEYTIRNFRKKIHLEEIAKIACISANSFCRYFKQRARKNYSQFVTELRIAHACELLIKTDSSIKWLCYESGFNNFTSFHKSFKQIMGMSPQAYREHRNLTG